MIEDQLIHVEATTARLSAEALAKLLSVSAHALAERHYSTKTGAQSLSLPINLYTFMMYLRPKVNLCLSTSQSCKGTM